MTTKRQTEARALLKVLLTGDIFDVCRLILPQLRYLDSEELAFLERLLHIRRELATGETSTCP